MKFALLILGAGLLIHFAPMLALVIFCIALIGYVLIKRDMRKFFAVNPELLAKVTATPNMTFAEGFAIGLKDSQEKKAL